MAENQGVWGIDIGQAGLKAIRLRYAEAAEQALAVSFDYIPHPKILNQPDAVPAELIAQALETFLSRNDVQSDLIAISLPGQSALARFIQLPPVESNKVAEIVKYEARQQIPFALEDVIWDFQTLGGGIEESGFMLGAEVGLFAMKREQVMEALQPFHDAKLEVELVQIAPLALHNFICYDELGIRAEAEFEAGEDYAIVLDMGTDNTTLLVTNGEKIWIRNVPIGGNHFTRALTKGMKLTFAKAEHLKCNATKSPDPRAVFQALRPVFNDYVSEIQRSIGYFSSVNREAKISKIIGAGNGFKLAGLQKFLQQNLQQPVDRIDTFQGIVGDTVLNAPLFQENVLSFVVPYGLALQALKLTKIHTTLLPPEIAAARKIRRKKPWAVATAATLLFGLATSTAGYSNVARSVSVDRFGKVEEAVKSLDGKVKGLNTKYTGVEKEHKVLVDQGELLVKTVDKREYWLELYRALNECLPRDVGNQLDEEDIRKKNRINVKAVTAQRYPDLGKWFGELNDQQKNYMLPIDKETLPTGPGYVVTIEGEHFHHDAKDVSQTGIIYVKNTLLSNLGKPTLQQAGTTEPVPVRRLNLTHATIVKYRSREKIQYYPNGKPDFVQVGTTLGPRGFGQPSPGVGDAGGPVAQPAVDPTGTGTDDANGDGTGVKYVLIDKTTFTLKFIWIPTLAKDRTDKLGPPPAANGQPPANGAAATGAPANGAPATGAPPATNPKPPGT